MTTVQINCLFKEKLYAETLNNPASKIQQAKYNQISCSSCREIPCKNIMHPLDVFPEIVWDIILGHLHDFEDRIHAERLCQLFLKKMPQLYWQHVEAFHVSVESEGESDVKVTICVDGVQPPAIYSMTNGLEATKAVARRAVNLKTATFNGSLISSNNHYYLSEICRCFTLNMTSTSLFSLKRPIGCDSFASTYHPGYNMSIDYLTLLIRKFSDTLTELHVPLCDALSEAIAECTHLETLFFDGVHAFNLDEQNDTILVAIRGRTLLKRFGCIRCVPLANKLTEAILATNSQLDFFMCDPTFPKVYWAHVQFLAWHPLKSITHFSCDRRCQHNFETIFQICPELKEISFWSKKSSLELWPLSKSLIKEDLHTISAYMTVCSVAGGNLHELTFNRVTENRSDSIWYLEQVADQLQQLGLNGVLTMGLDKKIPDISFRLGNASFAIAVKSDN